MGATWSELASEKAVCRPPLLLLPPVPNVGAARTCGFTYCTAGPLAWVNKPHHWEL